MMSHFAAIPIPAAASAALSPMQRGVKAALWHPMPKLHLTLAFFGEIENKKTATALGDALAGIKAKDLEINFDTVSWFGGTEPHSLFVSVARSRELDTLMQDCAEAAATLGLPAELPQAPHVTLAYVKKNCSNADVGEVLSWQAEHGATLLPSWPATQFGLYESGTKQPDGSYLQRRAFALT